MTYLEKWFDFNRRQKEIEGLLEETIAQQSDQSLTLKEFYLLYYLDLAQEKWLRTQLFLKKIILKQEIQTSFQAFFDSLL